MRVKLPGSVNGQQFIIENCTDCDLYILDHRSTGASARPFAPLRVDTATCSSALPTPPPFPPRLAFPLPLAARW